MFVVSVGRLFYTYGRSKAHKVSLGWLCFEAQNENGMVCRTFETNFFFFGPSYDRIPLRWLMEVVEEAKKKKNCGTVKQNVWERGVLQVETGAKTSFSP